MNSSFVLCSTAKHVKIKFEKFFHERRIVERKWGLTTRECNIKEKHGGVDVYHLYYVNIIWFFSILLCVSFGEKENMFSFMAAEDG